MRVSDVKAREKEQKMGVETMNKSRDLKIAAVAKRQEELKVHPIYILTFL